MSKPLFVQRIVAWGGRRISKDSNYVSLDPMRAEVADNDLESLTDKILPGTYGADISVKGGTSVELELYALKRLEQSQGETKAFTLCMDPLGPQGGRAAFIECRLVSFKWVGDFGMRKDFEAVFKPETFIAWGFVLFQGVGTAGISAPATGFLQLGALGAGQELILNYHVLDPPGVVGTTPTLDGKIQSGTSAAFTVPVDHLTLPQMTGPDGVTLRVDGDIDPSTDTWWRVNFTAPGGTGSPNFTVLVAAAIRSK